MEYKILESPGVEIDHIDGATFNNFSAGDSSGILKNVLDECVPVLIDPETVQISTGELLIKGFRIKITSPYTLVREANLYNTTYYLIAQVVASPKGQVTFNIEARQAPYLEQESIFVTGFGTYEIELCRFVVGSSGINNLVQTAKIISGYTKEEKEKIEKHIDTKVSKAVYNHEDLNGQAGTVYGTYSPSANSELMEVNLVYGARPIGGDIVQRTIGGNINLPSWDDEIVGSRELPYSAFAVPKWYVDSVLDKVRGYLVNLNERAISLETSVARLESLLGEDE